LAKALVSRASAPEPGVRWMEKFNMKKWLTSLSMIILGVGLCLISLAITIFVAPILLYMAPTAWVVVFGPPDYMTIPEDYAHRMIITSTEGSQYR
jgi:hypothetical protein